MTSISEAELAKNYAQEMLAGRRYAFETVWLWIVENLAMERALDLIPPIDLGGAEPEVFLADTEAKLWAVSRVPESSQFFDARLVALGAALQPELLALIPGYLFCDLAKAVLGRRVDAFAIADLQRNAYEASAASDGSTVEAGRSPRGTRSGP